MTFIPIASTRRVRGNPTVLVLTDFGIASADCVSLAMAIAMPVLETHYPRFPLNDNCSLCSWDTLAP